MPSAAMAADFLKTMVSSLPLSARPANANRVIWLHVIQALDEHRPREHSVNNAEPRRKPPICRVPVVAIAYGLAAHVRVGRSLARNAAQAALVRAMRATLVGSSFCNLERSITVHRSLLRTAGTGKSPHESHFRPPFARRPRRHPRQRSRFSPSPMSFRCRSRILFVCRGGQTGERDATRLTGQK